MTPETSGTIQWILTVASNHDILIYGLIVILACAEGPILSMIFGVLIKLGDFHFWPVYIALMAGDLLGDVIWYGIGYKLGHRFIAKYGTYFGLTEESVGKMTKIFHRYKYSILFISKISNGLGLAIVTLMTAGMVKIPFLKYMATNIVGQTIWSALLLGIGYYYSQLFMQIDNIFGKVTLVLVAVIALFLVVRLQKYLRAKTESL